MKCSASLEELSAYVDGELDSVRAAAVEEHLKVCESCRIQAASLRSMSGLIAGAADTVDPSDRLRAGLARRLAMVEELPRFTCSRIQVAMSEMLDGELPGEEAHLVSEHLRQCPACAAEYATLDRMALTVRALPEVEPPLGLERAIRAAIAREQQGLFRLPSLGELLQPRLAPAFASAVASIALMIGFWLGRVVPAGGPPQVANIPVYHGEASSVHTTPRAVAQQVSQPAARPARAVASAPSAQRRVAVRTPVTSLAVRRDGAAAHQPRAVPRPASQPNRRSVKPAGSGTTPLAPATVPVSQPLPATSTPAEPGPDPATAAAPPAPASEPAAVAEAPKPAPAALTIESFGQVQPTAPAETKLAERLRKRYQVDLEEVTALLNSQPPRKAVGATIAKVHF